MTGEQVRYAFLAEWYDEQASLTRSYQLLFYPHDQACEMFDLKSRRTFLRRTKLESLSLAQLYIGAIVHILSRQLKVVDYGDEYTLKRLGGVQFSLLMVGGEVLENLPIIFAALAKHHLKVCNAKTVVVDKQAAASIQREIPETAALLAPDKLGQFVLVGVNASEAVRGVAEVCAGFSVPVYFSQTHEAAVRDIEVFFGGESGQGSVPLRTTAVLGEGAVLGIVKPHAVTEGLVGPILQGISDAGFKVSAGKLFFMDRRNVEEFLEVYRGVVSEYSGMVDHLCSGPCLVLEVLASQKEFRELVGPADPEIGRHVRPYTLRARFGTDKLKNALHCTDLPEDAAIELEYFFKILD